MKRKNDSSQAPKSKQDLLSAQESARITKVIEMAARAVPEPVIEEPPKAFHKEEWPESRGKDSYASLHKELNWLGYDAEGESSDEKE